MNQNENLYLFIHSLSKSEKRYFKIYASHNSKQKNQVVLFNALNNQKTYDEKKLKQRLKNSGFVQRLSSEKVYLFHLILKSLRFYQSEKNLSKQLKEKMNDIQTLFERVLIKACYNLLSKTIKHAIEIEEHNTAIELLSLQLRYIRHSVNFREVSKEKYSEVYALRNKYIEILNQLNSLKNTSWKIYEAYSKYGKIEGEQAKKEIKQIANELPKSETKLLSNESRAEYFYIKSIFAYLKRDIELSISYTLKSVASFNPDIYNRSEYLLRRYVTILNNLIVFQIKTNDFISAFESIKKMKGLNLRTGQSSIYIDSYKYLYASLHELDIYISLGETTKIAQTLTLSVQYLEKYKKVLTAPSYNAVLFILARTYFILENFKKALYYINRLDLIDFDSFEKIQKLGLLNLITHYELGNYELVASLSKRYKSEFLQQKHNEKAILVFIDLFKLLQKAKSKKQQRTTNSCLITCQKKGS
ncbi:MAG TPA: hypothetical protein VNZ49_11660 [Bacteroidia bacterium]|jgi:hypothetical protein|nr:hypothetical protein [Bacteroidia bacterium]